MKKTLILFSFLAASAGLFASEPTSSATTEPITIQVEHEDSTQSLIGVVTDWYANNMSYWSVTALMTIESSFIPFPSEVVIPPAVYVASHEDSELNVTDSYFLNVLLIVLCGTLGALLGALINYFLSIWLGRPIIYAFADSKIGHLCLLSSEKVKKAEEYFNKHGKSATFIGRLIPGIRQLISIPAGLARMNIGVFLVYTFLGAFIWNVILAALGYIAHGQADLIDKYSHELSIVILGLLGLAILYWIVKKIIARNKAKK